MKGAAFIVAVAALVRSLPAAAAVDDPVVLVPSSRWTLDFADERCSLIRDFGHGDEALRLQIDAYGPQQGYVVTLSGPLVPGSPNAQVVEFSIGYSPDDGERKRSTSLWGKMGDENAVSIRRGFLPLPGSAMTATEFADSVESMTVAFRLYRPIRLETGNMAAPFSAMHQCVDDLLASWGIDPVGYAQLSQKARLDKLAAGFREIDPARGEKYPSPKERRDRKIAEAVAEAGGMYPVRLMIAASGKPTACVVQVAWPSETQRQAVCKQLSSHHYLPARDAAGEPVASFIQVEAH